MKKQILTLLLFPFLSHSTDNIPCLKNKECLKGLNIFLHYATLRNNPKEAYMLPNLQEERIILKNISSCMTEPIESHSLSNTCSLISSNLKYMSLALDHNSNFHPILPLVKIYKELKKAQKKIDTNLTQPEIAINEWTDGEVKKAYAYSSQEDFLKVLSTYTMPSVHLFRYHINKCQKTKGLNKHCNETSKTLGIMRKEIDVHYGCSLNPTNQYACASFIKLNETIQNIDIQTQRNKEAFKQENGMLKEWISNLLWQENH